MKWHGVFRRRSIQNDSKVRNVSIFVDSFHASSTKVIQRINVTTQLTTLAASNTNTSEITTVGLANLSNIAVRVRDMYKSGHFEPNKELCGPDIGKAMNNELNKMIIIRIISI